MAPAQLDSAASAIFRRLLGYAAPHWPMFVASAIGMVIAAATQPAFAYLIGDLLDKAVVARDAEVIALLPIAIIVLFVVRGFAGFAATYGLSWIGRHVTKTLRFDAFSRLLTLPTPVYDRSSSGVLLSKLTYDVEQVALTSSNVVTVLIRDGLTIIGLIAFLIYLAPLLAAIIFVVGVAVAWIIRLLSSRFRRYSTRIQASMGDVTRVSEEAIQGHRVVKVFNGQQYERDQFDGVNEKNRRLHMRLTAAKAGGDALTQLFAAFGVAGVIAVATTDRMLDTLAPGTFVSFVTAMVLLMAPLKRLTNVNMELQRGIAAGKSLFYLLDQESERDRGSASADRVRGDVVFDNVTFGYGHGSHAVLEGIDLEVPAGQTCAIVGRSGSGKSTLVSLLPRFYDSDSGEVRVDGRRIDEYRLDNLRDQISLVSQDVVLFNDSIANNIAYGGLRGATPEQIEQAATAAHVMEFAKDKPEGLDTRVGDRGTQLSGGQRQRIAIARALLKDAPILILDEATSSLDSESERHIQMALDELMQDRTTLVIAHRLSTVENADRIIVLHEGRMLESGTHDELVRLGGFYAALQQIQFHSGDAAANA